MLARVMPAVVSIRTAEVIPPAVLNRYRGRINPDKVMQDEKTGEVLLRSEEHTSELQSRFGISYAVFCLKKKTSNNSVH